jgi:hypothetical protein
MHVPCFSNVVLLTDLIHHLFLKTLKGMVTWCVEEEEDLQTFLYAGGERESCVVQSGAGNRFSLQL